MLNHRKAALLRRGSAGRFGRPLWPSNRRKSTASRPPYNLWLSVFRVGAISCPVLRVMPPRQTTTPPKGRTPKFGPFLRVCAGIGFLLIFAVTGGRGRASVPLCKNSFCPGMVSALPGFRFAPWEPGASAIVGGVFLPELRGRMQT